MCHLEKPKKALNIFDTIQPIFIKFYQNDRTVSGHLMLATDDLENVGQGQNLQKCSFLTTNISKETPIVKSC